MERPNGATARLGQHNGPRRFTLRVLSTRENAASRSGWFQHPTHKLSDEVACVERTDYPNLQTPDSRASIALAVMNSA